MHFWAFLSKVPKWQVKPIKELCFFSSVITTIIHASCPVRLHGSKLEMPFLSIWSRSYKQNVLDCCLSSLSYCEFMTAVILLHLRSKMLMVEPLWSWKSWQAKLQGDLSILEFTWMKMVLVCWPHCIDRFSLWEVICRQLESESVTLTNWRWGTERAGAEKVCLSNKIWKYECATY